MTTATKSTFSSIEEAIRKFREGEFVVVMDDEDRENEGDIVLAAQFVTPEKVAFALRTTSGILCAPLTTEIATRLQLPPMVEKNNDPNRTAFTVTVDHIQTTTGVSSHDRSLSFQALASASSTAEQFRRPGHIFPLVARQGGVLERRGHTEATVDLCRLAGLYPVGFLAELMNEDGTMSRLSHCIEFAEKHQLPIITVEQLAKYREQLAGSASPATSARVLSTVEMVASCTLPIQRLDQYLGEWDCRIFASKTDGAIHTVLIKGQLDTNSPILTRVHSECFTGNTLGSIRCDCGDQLDQSMFKIAEHGSGIIVYVGGHEGRGIGLINKIKAYALQDSHHLDTYQSNEFLGFKKDQREYESVVAILKALNVSRIDLMTNNKFKYQALNSLIVKVTPLVSKSHPHNEKYLEAKKKEQAYHHEESAPSTSAPTPTPATPTPAPAVAATPSSDSSEENLAPELRKEIPIRLPTPTNLSKLVIGLVRTAWNQKLVDSLADQTRDQLIQRGVLPENILETTVPGSFELPWAAQQLVKQANPDVVLCFGVLLKGETMHFEYISASTAQGLMQVQLTTDVPVLDAVLNCLTLEQADARCNTKSQLPNSLSATAIHMAALKRGYLPLVKNAKGDVPASFNSVLAVQPCGQ